MPLLSRRAAIRGGAGSALLALAPRGWAQTGGGEHAPTGLLCNLMDRLAVVEGDTARLSWIVPDMGPATRQSAYHLQITPIGGATIDTGWIAGDASTAIPLALRTIAPDSACLWRVRVKDQAANISAWSAPAHFVTAPRAWTAQPIWAPPATTGNADWALIRHGFTLPARPALAWLRITALSPEPTRQYVFRASINGRFVGVGPVRSPHPGIEERYATLDVTDALRAGPNALAALCYTSQTRAFIAELVVIHADGTRQIIASGPTWRALDGAAWRPASGFTGGGYYTAPQEYIDARAEPVGWDSADFDDSTWPTAMPAAPTPALRPDTTGPMVLTRHSPASIKREGGRWIIDMGRELVGGLAITATAKGGETLTINLGEERNPDGTVRSALRSGQTYREVWTLRAGEQVLSHWGYRAFRWVQIDGPADATITAVYAQMLAQPWREEALFESSDPDLNRVRDLCAWSIRATRQDLYQDTPTRERGPYEGDAIINQLSEYAVQRSFALPRNSIAHVLARPTWPTEYRLMTPVLAWRDWLATGDDAFMRAAFDAMMGAQLIDHVNADGLVEKDPGQSSHPLGDLVDWPISNRDGFAFTRVNAVVNAWQYAALVALGDMAGVIGRRDDATRLAAMATRLRAGFNAALLAPGGLYRDGVGTDHCSQHASAFALSLGLADDATTRRAAAQLATQGMKVSVYGAQFLLDALYRGGQADAALGLMTARGPASWTGMIDQWGATIAMEAWDPGLKPNTTFSHAWGTAPVNIITRHIAGIAITAPGAARVSITPQPGRLARFAATMPTIRGEVGVAWDGGQRRLSVTLPPNTGADLRFAIPVDGVARAHVSGRGTLDLYDKMVMIPDLLPGTTAITLTP